MASRLTTIGCPTIIVPWLPEADRLTHSDVRRFAAELGDLAVRFADRGLRLGYHNHAFEFDPIDGTTIWDILRPSCLPRSNSSWTSTGRPMADRTRWR